MTNEELKAHIDQRLDNMMDASRERNEATNNRIDKLYGLMPDTAQAMAQVQYIFDKDGGDLVGKVEKHHAVYTKGKALGGLVGLICSWVGWDTVKNHLHWGGK